jgi:subtilisin family serine protease
MMIAANILKVAPDVKLFDLPMVPERITDIPDFFLSTADAAYATMRASIKQYKLGTQFPGPWVIVNAWAVFDRASEFPPGDYTNNPNHPFNVLVGQLVDDGNDVVFCAGNCGQFCPDIRCGGKDRGPGNSVFGANCHPKVLSVGAVRTDTIWLGYSSQGPGQPLLGYDKPDLCAPSQFCETGDAFTTNGGTSAACALAAGVVAALRSVPVWQSSAVPPQDLKAILNGTATKTDGPTWNGRVGNGILNADAAFKKLDSIIPAPPHP